MKFIPGKASNSEQNQGVRMVLHGRYSLFEVMNFVHNSGINKFMVMMTASPKLFPRREAGDVCLPPVWNLRAVTCFHFAIASLVLQPSPGTLSILYFSAAGLFF